MQDGRLGRFAAWMGSWRGWCVVLGALLVGFSLVVWLGGSEWRDAIEIREGKGRNVRALDLAMAYGWRAALINCGLVAGLLATVRWWGRETSGLGEVANRTKISKGFWAVVALAVLTGAVLRMPRMELSLYNDEAYTLRRQVSGEFKQRGGEMEFRQALWSETLFENEIANNPVLFSVLARISFEGWKSRAGGADGEVNEFWYRFPSLVAGLLGIAAAAWLGLAIGSARIGGLAAVLVAFHPWHVRYSTEARGYGLLLLLIPLMLVAFTYAMRTGRWRWWVLFAAAQFLASISFVGVLYFSVTLNGAAFCWLAWIRWRGKKSVEEGEQGSGETFSSGLLLGRLVVANVVSGILFLSLMAPHLPQIRDALNGVEAHQATGDNWRWWPDVLAYLGLGMPWFDGATGSEIDPSVMRVWGGAEGRTILGAVLAAAVLFAMGIANAWRTGVAGRCLALGVLVTPPFYYMMTALRGNALFDWHLIFFVPVVVGLIALGVSRGKPGVPFKLTSGGVIRIVLAVMVFGGFSIPLERYIKNPKEDPRAMVREARGGVYPGYLENEKQVVFAAFNCVGVYDPLVKITPSVPLIREQMDRADREGKEFFVQFARRPLVADDVLELLENSGEFQLVKEVPGLEEAQYTNYLFRAIAHDKNGSTNE